MEKNLLVAGFGGQGVMTLGMILSETVCHNTDKFTTFFPSYGAEQRGGTANCYVVISPEEIGAPVADQMDDLIVMNGPSLEKFLPQLKPGGTLYANSSMVPEDLGRGDIHVVKAPATDMSLALGNPRVLNIIMMGLYLGYSQTLEPQLAVETLKRRFASKPALIDLNITAFQQGLDKGKAARQNQ